MALYAKLGDFIDSYWFSGLMSLILIIILAVNKYQDARDKEGDL